MRRNQVEERRSCGQPITKKTFGVYTLLFLMVTTLVFSGFYLTRTSFIWDGDGFSQHYLLFYDYLERLHQLFRGGGFSMWDWTIGMGADVIQSYGYYVIGDPFVYLGLLFPASMAELAFHFTILVRLWCIGGAFLFYARKMKFSHQAGLLGAGMYTFTHYAMMNVIRHPFFMIPMIWYPLLCLGIEKIFRKESNRLFIVMVAMSAFSNFYFFYKLTILSFLYAAVRFYQRQKEGEKDPFWLTLWRGSYAYLIGLMVAGVLFLPMVASFLGSSRSGGTSTMNPFLYPLDYYPSLILNFLVPGSYLWTVGGFSFFVLFALPFVWEQKGKLDFVKILLTILGVGVLFPLFGSFMNGFSGPYNRYTFSIPFFLSIASAAFFDSREEWTDQQGKRSFRLLLFFTVFLVGAVFVRFLQPIGLLAVAVGWSMWFLLRREQRTDKQKPWLLIGLVILNMAANNIVYYYPPGKNTIASRIPYGTAKKEYADLFDGLEKQLPERGKDPYRVGVTSKDNEVRNQFIYLDLMGLNSYLSLTNGSLSDFSAALETSQFQLIQPLRKGFDDRRLTNHTLGVRYIMTEEENEELLPFGYEVIKRSKSKHPILLAETQDAFPLAYTVDTWLSNEAFEQLDPIEKEMFLTKGATTEEKPENAAVTEFNGTLPVEELSFSLLRSDGTSVDETKVAVTEKNETFELEIEEKRLQGKDVFVYLDGIDFEPLNVPFWENPRVNYTASVQMNDREKSVYQSNPLSFSSYFHRDEILFNMGHLPKDETLSNFTLQFTLPGIYHFKQMKVIVFDADKKTDQKTAEIKRENQLDFKKFEGDEVIGTLEREEPSLFVTSLPFAEGWKAEVNGKDAELLIVNKGFLGLEVPAGKTTVKLTYQTPFLLAGLSMSIFGLILFAVNSKRWGGKKEGKNEKEVETN